MGGKVTLSNGDKFKGKIVNNKKEGKGTYYYKDGSVYDGDFHNDLMEGQGTY